jgi:uncharacterized phage protein (TIGR01671 family)
MARTFDKLTKGKKMAEAGRIIEFAENLKREQRAMEEIEIYKREFKFRSWGPNCKHMWQWESLQSVTFDYLFNIGEKIIMQFTGLLDKNGREVYEGDIVNYMYPETPREKPQPFIAVIEYVDESASFRAIGLASNIENHIWQDVTLEVIGNIHENPGLLGEK